MFLRNVGIYRRVYTAPNPEEHHHLQYMFFHLKPTHFTDTLKSKKKSGNCF
jgi:hypothetical protein